jgi:hypothetical protein
MTSITEITIVGGDRLQVEGEAKQIESQILAAARGSILEFAWMTEANTGQRVGINPDQVLMLRALDPAPDADPGADADGASAGTIDA